MADDTALDLDALTRWLSERTATTPPLAQALISGGRSNLTYKITDADGRAFVVRRPPLGPLLPGAHDMSREYDAMAALADTAVPVPSLVGNETSEAVLGAPFYCMHFVDGLIVRTEAKAAEMSVPARRRAASELATIMADLHAVDPESVGLGRRSKGEDYVARQLHVWKRQLEMCVLRDTSFMDGLHARLVERIPPQETVSIVHGDYRLDNVMLSPEGEVLAVLDWELRTLGDPLADLAITLSYWNEADDAVELFERPTTLEGFGTREDFIAAYVDAGGQPMPEEHHGTYMAFASWRLAAILEGVYQRNLSGQYGEQDDEDWKVFEDKVPALADVATAWLGA